MGAGARASDGWSLDVMRRRLDAEDLPNGLMDALLVATSARWRRGGGGLALNFAVMRQVLDPERLGRAGRRCPARCSQRLSERPRWRP